jgi:hypothetical protein
MSLKKAMSREGVGALVWVPGKDQGGPASGLTQSSLPTVHPALPHCFPFLFPVLPGPAGSEALLPTHETM